MEKIILGLLMIYKKNGFSPKETAMKLNDAKYTFREKEWTAARVNYVLRSCADTATGELEICVQAS